MSRKHRTGEAALTTGLVLTAAFGLAWYLTRNQPLAWLWLFPMVFAGLLPAISGRGRGGKAHPDRGPGGPGRGHAGVPGFTPALVALKTELSIEESQGLLEQMARKRYAVRHVRDNGRIEFEFPEFH